MNQTILVTGGAGYIGTHAVKELRKEGFEVIVLDNLVYGHRELVEQVLEVSLVVGDICDRPFLDKLFETYDINAVMHFAAFAYVGESVKNPAKYYANNVMGTLTLLQAMQAAGIDKIVFSSTCATYGTPEKIPISEDHPQNPINPYGRSKWMVEQVLSDFSTAYDLKAVCFRYFNAAGADPAGLLGEDHNPETHLIPLVLQVALGQRDSVSILGTNYPTPDGTCIRDYIHVTDLAQAHVLGLEYLLQGGDSQTFNLSNGSGFSVREVIETARTVTGQPIKAVEKERRPGDPAILIGSSDKALQVLEWQPKYPDLEDIMRHAWHWHQKRHGLPPSAAATLPIPDQTDEFKPLVSVIIPAYNAEAFIPKTLESVLLQTYRHLEILVVDDGSSDGTPEIISTFARQDSRIRVLHQSNSGVATARNLAIDSAQGELIAPIDADDLWASDTVEKLVAQFQTSRPEVGVVYAWSADIDEYDQPTGGFHAANVDGNVYKTLICHNFLGNASSTLIRKTCLKQVGGYNTQLKRHNAQGCEDWDLYLRLAEQYEFGVVPEFLVGYRKMTNSMSGDFKQMARSQRLMLKTVQKKHPEIPAFLYRVSCSSFYLYLAHQCDLQRDSGATLAWLWRAVRVDHVTPLGRLGFYHLLIKNLVLHPIKLLRQLFRSETVQDHALAGSSKVLIFAPSEAVKTITQPEINCFKIWLKVFVGNVLHQSLSRV